MPALLFLVVTLGLVAAGCSKTAPKKSEVEEPASTAEAKAPAEEVVPDPVTYDLTSEQEALIFDTALETLGGEATTLGALRGKPILVVNVASECGLTPQYEQLQAIQEQYQEKGFVVVGFPSNQFGEQEPGTAEEILAFGKEHYGVTFPVMQKVEANGPGRHPVYQALTQIKDAYGEAGDVAWNFEKFVLSADGKKVTRFRPKTLPTDPQILAIVEKELN